jgi:prolipoprotein diacylglyceryltransferase
MIGDFLIIGVMLLIYARFWRIRPGLTFFTGLVLYSAMRFGVSYLRLDSCPVGTGECPEYIVRDWMTFPQVVSVVTFSIGVVGLAWAALRPRRDALGVDNPRTAESKQSSAAPSKA